MIALLAKGIALPSISYYIQIKSQCMSIFENLAVFISIRGTHDFFLTCLRDQVFSSDRGMIISALRSLTGLCKLQFIF